MDPLYRGNVVSFRCIHLADVHFRGLTRHQEYKESFEDFFKQAKLLEPDVIYLGGDIVHSKTQGISPELIDLLSWWFTKLAEIAPTHIILGNHDGLILNKYRQDAISPIINALDNPNLYLYKKSGVYPTGVEGYNWCVFSCFDEKGWSNVKSSGDAINIALFHGAVQGSQTDIEWQIEGEVDLEFFTGFDFAFLGDIHKTQFLDSDRRIAYCGSSIQQNYGEDPGKGFLFWEIENRDTFTSTFYPIAHRHPFVTLDWQDNVSDTLRDAQQYDDFSRFRIRAPDLISQAEIKRLYAALKQEKKAHEIVFKYDQLDSDNSIIKSDLGDIFRDDLRDPKIHLKLLRQFYIDTEISDETWGMIERLIDRYINHIGTEDKLSRNLRWSIKRFEFDNMFSYGKGNVIDFDKLTGITGIFGKNRVGKSSIPGALMYTLFNTTDRGPIKNLHVINMRKGHCFGKIDFDVNGNLYRAERQSARHQTRKGKQHAVTHLNLSRLNAVGEEIQDLNGEQRRETEKMLRSLVGVADDFLMTSLASQGEMNSFIKNKATQRKTILGKFLDLNVFDRILDIAKRESSTTKALLKRAPNKDWGVVIEEKEKSVDLRIKERTQLTKELDDKRYSLQQLQITLATHKDKDVIAEDDILRQKNRISGLKNDAAEYEKQSVSITTVLDDINFKLEKICKIKDQFPINELNEQFNAQINLERNLVELEYSYEKELALLKTQKKSVSILNEVPCGDEFPMCKFIKNSHKNKQLLLSQEEKAKEILSNVRASKKMLKKLKRENLKDKIQRYNDVLLQESDLCMEKSNRQIQINELDIQLNNCEKLIDDCEKELISMNLRVSSSKTAIEVSKLRQTISDLNANINHTDTQRLLCSETIVLLQKEIENLKREKNEWKDLLDEWKSYEILLNAVSKKGIPLQIMNSQLPLINVEISKILQGVVGFTVELLADPDSSDMDIFINYGDSKRIIECASGMEKMMASLAIRVALINISCLPKTDVLIIDEGFGALDEMNVEACNRLLGSLKKWFKNILVISHVDAVKDAVDNVLEITCHGKDANILYE